MLLPVKKNLLVYKGTRFKQVINASVKNCSTRQKEPVDLSQYRAFMKVMKKECGCEKEVLFDLNNPDTYIEVTDGVAGEITIDIPPAVTHAFDFSCGDYWIIMQHKTSADNYVLMHGEFSTVCTFLTEPDPTPPIIDVVLVGEIVGNSPTTRRLYSTNSSTALADLCRGTQYAGNGGVIGTNFGVELQQIYFQLLADPTSTPILLSDTADPFVYEMQWFSPEISNSTNGGWVAVLTAEGIGGIDVEVLFLGDDGNGLEKFPIQNFRIEDLELVEQIFTVTASGVNSTSDFGYIHYNVTDSQGQVQKYLYIFAIDEIRGAHIGTTFFMGILYSGSMYDTDLGQMVWLERSGITTGSSVLVITDISGDGTDSIHVICMEVSIASDEVGPYIQIAPLGVEHTFERPVGTKMNKVLTCDTFLDKVSFTVYGDETDPEVMLFDFSNTTFVHDQYGSSGTEIYTNPSPTDMNFSVICGWDWDNTNILIPITGGGLSSFDPLTGEVTPFTEMADVGIRAEGYRGVQSFRLDTSAGLSPFSCIVEDLMPPPI
tara:strand:- start:8158 stop:9789 length:1632 start_codon:yes stop_codon:yes gene_type:complete